MTSLRVAIAAELRADPVISEIATGGVHTRDIRRAGPDQVPEAFGPMGQRKPALVIADAGAVPDAFNSVVVGDLIQVIAIAAPTDAGNDAVDELLGRVIYVMHRWQHPVTGAMAFNAGRVGGLEDDNMVQDRVTLRVAGVPLTKRS